MRQTVLSSKQPSGIPSTAKFVLVSASNKLKETRNMKIASVFGKGRLGSRAYYVLFPDEKQHAVLFGKGTDLYMGTVSIRDEAFLFAVGQNIPLIGGLRIKDTITFFVFDPVWINDGHADWHEKFKNIIRFPFKLGETWQNTEKLESVIKRLKARYEAEKERSFSRKEERVLSEEFTLNNWVQKDFSADSSLKIPPQQK